MKFKLLDMLRNDYFHLVIMPTEACNFRCRYCYEDYYFGKMNNDVITGIQNLIKNRFSTLKQLDISWFGGEPLIAMDIIKKIANFINSLSNTHPSVVVRQHMTTNGYLLDENYFNELIAMGINSFQITLDGNKNIHDKVRLTLGGKGTFEKILSNLHSIQKSQVEAEIILRLHYSNENWKQLIKFIQKIEAVFSIDKRFKLLLKAIEPYEGTSPNSITPLSMNQKEYIENVLLDSLNNHSFAVNKLTDGSNVCYAARANSIVIRSNGRIAKCTVALYDKQNDIGRLLVDGNLDLDQTKLKPWLIGMDSGKQNDLSCPYNSIRSISST